MATLQKETPRVSLIILNYHTNEMVKGFVERLQTGKDYEIIVVDNSENGSLRKEIKTSNSIHYLYPGKNLGFSAGNNLGVQHTTGEWILLLNSDASITSEQIDRLIIDAHTERALVSAPKLVYENGTTQKSAGFFDSFFVNPVNGIFARPRFLIGEESSKKQFVDFATGACLLINRKVVERIGLFDEKNFFMYFEDIDLGYRLKQNNIPILYNPDVIITHIEGASADQNKIQKHKWYQEGLFNYIKKHRTIVMATINTFIPLFK